MKLRPRTVKAFALLAALGACTPIAPSFYKAARVGSLGGAAGGEAARPTLAAVQVLLFDSKVEDGDSYAGALTSAATAPYVQIHFSPETNSSAFEQFRSQGHLPVPMGSVLPEEVTAHVKLGLAGLEIQTLGLQEFKTTLRPGADGSQWALSIRDNVPADISQAALEHLEEITLVVKPGSRLAP